MSQQERSAHDSHFCFQIIKFRAFKKALPGLGGQKSKGEVLFLVVLIILAIFGGIAAGYQIDMQLINPPTQLVGVCTPPGELVHGGCFIVTQTTDSSGKTTNVYTPSGTLYLANGSKY